MPPVPLHAVLTRAASYPCCTMRKSGLRHNQAHDHRTLARLQTYAMPPVRSLDYTTWPPMLGQAKARDHNLPAPLQSVSCPANRFLYQTMLWHFVGPAMSLFRASTWPRRASSSAAEYSPLYPRALRYYFLTQVRDQWLPMPRCSAGCYRVCRSLPAR